MIRIAVGWFSFIHASFVIAASEAASNPEPVSNFMGQVLFVLLLIVGLLFALAWVLKRSGLVNSSFQGHIKIIGGVSVGPRERIVLLQVGNEQIVVGVTAVEINLLHMLTEPIVLKEESANNMQTFKEVFADRMQRIVRVKKDEPVQ